MIQIARKLKARTIFEVRIVLNVFVNKRYNTQVIIPKGTTVSKVSTILNAVAAPPTRDLCVKSLANKTKDVAPCSNAIQKNTVKKAKITKAIILSLVILVYLDILEITRNKNKPNVINNITPI